MKIVLNIFMSVVVIIRLIQMWLSWDTDWSDKSVVVASSVLGLIHLWEVL